MALEKRVKVFHHPDERNLTKEVNEWLREVGGYINIINYHVSYNDLKASVHILYEASAQYMEAVEEVEESMEKRKHGYSPFGSPY